MADATTTRRRSTKQGEKAAQDKAQREAKAAAAKQEEPTPVDPDEASEAELAAQKGRPSNEEQVAPEAEAGTEEQGESESPAEAEFEIGALAPMPKVTSSGKASVWTDRLNDAAEKIEAADFPTDQGVAVLVCATPRTAANTANGVRTKIKAEKISGLLPGFASPRENGEFQIVTRGRAILVGFKAKS